MLLPFAVSKSYWVCLGGTLLSPAGGQVYHLVGKRGIRLVCSFTLLFPIGRSLVKPVFKTYFQICISLLVVVVTTGSSTFFNFIERIWAWTSLIPLKSMHLLWFTSISLHCSQLVISMHVHFTDSMYTWECSKASVCIILRTKSMDEESHNPWFIFILWIKSFHQFEILFRRLKLGV